MTYLALSVLFLAASVCVLVVAVARMPDRRRRVRRLWLPIVIAGVVLGVLTAVFDNLMIVAGFMSYRSTALSGLSVGAVPIEDFAYPLAAVILLPSLWALLESGVGKHSRDRNEHRR